MNGFDRGVYRRWIVANAWAELLGLGGTLLLGWWLAGTLGEPSTVVAVLGAALFAIVAGTFLEGVIVGFAQARVLRTALPTVTMRRWIAATAIGAGVAWTLGVIPSSAMALAGGPGGGDPPAWRGPLAQLALAAMLGLVLGPFLAIPQTVVLRRHVRRAIRWIPANALAWALGMPVVFLGAGLLPASAEPALVIAGLGFTCLIAGGVVGAVHGLVLVRLLETLPARAEEPFPHVTPVTTHM